MKPIRKALTLAGSDSGGSAGIQADLKTFAALGVYGTSAITAITAQNTVGVTQVLALAPDLVAAQVDAVIDDIGAHALKTGMLANTAIIDALRRRRPDRAACPRRAARRRVDAHRGNKESRRGCEVVSNSLAGASLSDLFQRAGDHRMNDPMTEENVPERTAGSAGSGKQFRALNAPRIRTKNTHGTGCTFSAAIAANLAKGETLERAVSLAKQYITGAIRAGFTVGSGHGPVNHFYKLWKR